MVDRARVQAEQEAVRRTAEEAAERERAAAERELAAEAKHRESFRSQQDAAKLEWERKSRVRKQEHEVRNKESKLLSPESSQSENPVRVLANREAVARLRGRSRRRALRGRDHGKIKVRRRLKHQLSRRGSRICLNFQMGRVR